jgi:endonuclease III
LSTSDPSKKLQALAKKLRAEHGEPGESPFPTPFPADDFGAVLHQFIYSMLLWESTSPHANHAAKRLLDAVVDLNELRICFAEELADLFGERYPKCKERAQRLKAALSEIYKREHSLSLERLAAMSKRDARTYLETLDGVPHYVAHRVLLVCVGGHAVPCDQRLQYLLEDEKAIEPGLTVEEASSWLEHQFKSGEGVEAHFLLQHWSDDNTPAPRKERKPEPPPQVKKPAEPRAARPASKAATKPAAKPAKAKPDPKSDAKSEAKSEKTKSAR